MNVNFHGAVLGSDYFRGLCMAANGQVLAVPYSHTNDGGILRITPSSDPMGFVKIPVAPFKSSAVRAWLSASLAPNGKIMLSTWEQSSLLVVDTLDPTWPVSSTSAGGSGPQRSQCVGQDGNWWSMPYDSRYVRVVNSTTNAVTLYQVSYQDQTHPSAGAIVDADYNRPAGAGGHYCRYWGAVAGPGKMMYAMPFNAERVLIVNPDAANTPADPVAYESGGPLGLVTGNNWSEEYQNQWYAPGALFPLGVVSTNSPAQKYSGGTLCPISGKIIAMPRRSPAVLVIDPSKTPAFGEDSPAGFITEIPLPKDNVDFHYSAAGGGSSNYFGSAHLADGRIIAVPWQNYKVVIWDGRTETVSFHTIDELAPANAVANSGASNLFYTSGLLLEDGRTIFSPYSPTKFMTVDLGPGKTVSRANLLQRWINRSM